MRRAPPAQRRVELMSDATTPLDMAGISKSFGGVDALKDVNFTLQKGEIRGVVGENGAGKSTLMKIVAGVHVDYRGTMRVHGREVRFRSARNALEVGIGMVQQELSSVPELTVAENVLLGRQPTNRYGIVDWARMVREAGNHLRGLGLDVDPRARMGSLPIGMQQLVEISRVLFSGADIIILDEPTSALSPPEVEQLFAVLRRMRDAGPTFVFISHFLDDVLRISDSVTVFHNGRSVVTERTAKIDKKWLIERMIGVGHGELEAGYAAEFQLNSRLDAPVVLETEGLSLGRVYRNVSLQIRAGEVLGVYGFMGCGQIELARTLFGKLQPDAGTMRLQGRPQRLRSTAAARQAGLAFVPENRRSMLFYQEPIYKSISISILDRLSRLLLRPDEERRIAAKRVKEVHVVPPVVERLVATLSGGNQQKVGLAKWLTFLPKVLILCEPTRGMDVGAKADVVRIVRGLRERGIGILVASTEPETVLALADRILVMRKGEIGHEFASELVSKDRLLAAS